MMMLKLLESKSPRLNQDPHSTAALLALRFGRVVVGSWTRRFPPPGITTISRRRAANNAQPSILALQYGGPNLLYRRMVRVLPNGMTVISSLSRQLGAMCSCRRRGATQMARLRFGGPHRAPLHDIWGLCFFSPTLCARRSDAGLPVTCGRPWADRPRDRRLCESGTMLETGALRQTMPSAGVTRPIAPVAANSCGPIAQSA
jgi:hypothetical protein